MTLSDKLDVEVIVGQWKSMDQNNPSKTATTSTIRSHCEISGGKSQD